MISFEFQWRNQSERPRPRRPPQFDASLAKDSSEYMLYGVALHCVFAVLMRLGRVSKRCGASFEGFGAVHGAIYSYIVAILQRFWA